MLRALKPLLLLILLVTLSPPLAALELFGVNLESSAGDELRDAARLAGVELIREGGEEFAYDVYDSSAMLEGSSRLYLGFVNQDQRFAFAEYEFIGLDTSPLWQRLTAKYGTAEIEGGRFLSDRSYRWQRDGIDIHLYSDWHHYRVRLSYVSPAGLAALIAEQAGTPGGDKSTPVVSLY